MKKLTATLARWTSYDWAAVSWRRFWLSMALTFLNGALLTAAAIPPGFLAVQLLAHLRLPGGT